MATNPLNKKVSVQMSPVVYERMSRQAAEVGVPVHQYATLMIAQTSLQVDVSRAAMPEAMQSAVASMSERLLAESGGEDD